MSEFQTGSDTVRVETAGNVFTVIINRPHVRNAIDREAAEALGEVLGEFEADPRYHVAVLCGSGGNFCSGGDLAAISALKNNALIGENDGPLGISARVLTKPVIAAVSGYAVAGGLELALFCDMRIAEESAVFGVFNRRWGLPLCNGGTVRLPRIIGQGRAMDMILTGRPVHAEEALAFGLANRIVKDGTAREEAEKLASEMARFPVAGMRCDRFNAISQFSMGLDDALTAELKNAAKVLETADPIKGARAFVNGKGRHGAFNESE